MHVCVGRGGAPIHVTLPGNPRLNPVDGCRLVGIEHQCVAVIPGIHIPGQHQLLFIAHVHRYQSPRLGGVKVKVKALLLQFFQAGDIVVLSRLGITQMASKSDSGSGGNISVSLAPSRRSPPMNTLIWSWQCVWPGVSAPRQEIPWPGVRQCAGRGRRPRQNRAPGTPEVGLPANSLKKASRTAGSRSERHPAPTRPGWSRRRGRCQADRKETQRAAGTLKVRYGRRTLPASKSISGRMERGRGADAVAQLNPFLFRLLLLCRSFSL